MKAYATRNSPQSTEKWELDDFHEVSSDFRKLQRRTDYESGGQEFESLRARQQLFDFDSEFLRDFSSLDSLTLWAAPRRHANRFAAIAFTLAVNYEDCTDGTALRGKAGLS